MKKQLLTGAITCSSLAFCSLLQATPAEAITLGFQNISANSITDATIGESQLLVDITDDGNNGVNFKFENIGPGQSTISEIYFDDGLGALIPSATLTQGTGVDFTAGSANPPNLPAGNEANPDFNVTNGFLADANQPAPTNGINNKLDIPGNENTEYLTLNYALDSDVTFNDLITALTNPDFDNNIDFRIGLHVINFASGGSESFINNTTTPVPTPALLPGLIGMGVASIRKKKKQVEQNS